MTDFTDFWDAQFPSSVRASLMAGLTEDSINDYLKQHRVHDRQRYKVEKSFGAGTDGALELTMIVGATKTEHDAGKGTPLKITLPAAAPVSIDRNTHAAVHTYPKVHGVSVYDYLSDRLSGANVHLAADNVSLTLNWPRRAPDGAPGPAKWTHEVQGINLLLEARLELIQDDERYSVRIVPLKLHVTAASETALRESIKAGIREHTPAPELENKVTDLFVAIVQLGASMVGPNLAQNIQIPLIEMSTFKVVPTAMAVANGKVSVAAHLDVADHAAEVVEQVDQLRAGYARALAEDLDRIGGAEALVYSQETLKTANAMSEHERALYLLAQEGRGESDMEQLLTSTNAFVARETEAIEASLAHLARVPRRGSRTHPQTRDREGLPAIKGGLAVAVSEETFNRLVQHVGGTHDTGYTSRLDLGLVRGRLGYELTLGTPNIDINAQGLTGSIFVDVFAGLYYQLKEVLNCSWRWGREHDVGLGVTGTPKITLSTRKSSGLSIIGKAYLGGLDLRTGLGSVVDRLINALVKPFKKLIELVLNGFLRLISFVVVPVEFHVPEQSTAIKLSRFDTALYERPDSHGVKRDFLLITADFAAVKG